MKKILLLLLLTVTYFSSAQSTYSIAKPLQLQTVNESTSKSDSVLVRGIDKIVKFVPRSEFSGNGVQSVTGTGVNNADPKNPVIMSVTPTLQEVTDTGSTTTNKIILDDSGKDRIGELDGAAIKFSVISEPNNNTYIDNTLININTAGGDTYFASPAYTQMADTDNTVTLAPKNLFFSEQEGNSIDIRTDNLTTDVTTNQHVLQLPTASGTLPVSVNGNFANANGNITIEVGGGGVDGSETKLIAGSNITVTGAGTIPNPYVVNYNPPYKVYKALISQNGTNAPTAIVLENTLGGDVVWTRDGAGIYLGTLTGAFNNNKTMILVGRTISNFYCVAKAFSDFIFLGSVDKSVDGGTDSFLNKMPIEVTVYN